MNIWYCIKLGVGINCIKLSVGINCIKPEVEMLNVELL
jgi:hypothetical protein